MRFSFLLASASLFVGCTIYDNALLAEAVGEDGTLPIGDGDGNVGGDGDVAGTGAVTGDGDAPSTGATAGDGDSTGGMGGSGDGDGDTGTGGGDGDGDVGTGGGDGDGDTGTIGLESLLEDFTAPYPYINIVDGRSGPWAVWVDPTPGGVMSPGPTDAFEAEPREDDAMNTALHITCTGFDSYGCGAYAMLNHDGSDPHPYDMDTRGYDAIRFWAKMGATGAVSQLQIAFGDEMSTAEPFGTCPVPCNDPDKPTANAFLTSDWQEFTLPFNTFTRRLSPNPLDPTTAFELQVSMGPGEVDFWIDDIRLVDTDG